MNPIKNIFRCLKLGALLLATLVWGGGSELWAQSGAPSENQVEAAFLYNFGKFVEWPTNAFADAYSPFVIGVVGDNQLRVELERIVANKKINNHLVVVRAVTAASAVNGCHIVFISSAALKKSAVILAAMDHPGILTVTEGAEYFTGSDLIINFVRVDSKIRFEINAAVAGKAGLKISSKLLTLAKS